VRERRRDFDEHGAVEEIVSGFVTRLGNKKARMDGSAEE